jgi:hypothetical protein
MRTGTAFDKDFLHLTTSAKADGHIYNQLIAKSSTKVADNSLLQRERKYQTAKNSLNSTKTSLRM